MGQNPIMRLKGISRGELDNRNDIHILQNMFATLLPLLVL